MNSCFCPVEKRAKYDKIQVADPTEKSLFLQKHIIHQISPRKQAKKKNQKLLSEPFIDGGKEGLTWILARANSQNTNN